MKNFHKLIRGLEYIVVSNNKYYSILSLYNKLKCEEEEVLITDDKIILPYYIYNNSIYEIYDFELIIKKGKDKFNKYVSKKTGQKKISCIDKNIYEKLRKCYISSGENHLINQGIMLYIDYVFNDNELKERLWDIFGTFDIKNIFFEIY